MNSKRFLVAAMDSSVVEVPPVLVDANSAQDALWKYLTKFKAKEDDFKEWVLDRAVNMSFAERFFLTTKQENERFSESGSIGTADEIVESRMRNFFKDAPELGQLYVRYFKSGDKSLIKDEVLVYIAQKEEPEEHGMVALDLSTVDYLG